MEKKFKGIILKLTEHKDADKLASVFSLEFGKIGVKFTGVKRDGAKLKSVAQPFCFAEFVATGNSGLVVTSAEIIDGFTAILTDYNKTICAYIVLDIINSILPKEKPETDIFVLALSALKAIEQENEYLSTINFVLQFINFSGLALEFVNSNFVYLDNYSGNFTTEHTQNCVQIDKRIYLAMKEIAEKNSTKANDNTLKQILRLLHNILFLKFGEDIKSFNFI